MFCYNNNCFYMSTSLFSGHICEGLIHLWKLYFFWPKLKRHLVGKKSSDDCRVKERGSLLSSDAANMTEKSHRTGRTHHFLRDIILVSIIIVAIIIKLMSLTSFACIIQLFMGWPPPWSSLCQDYIFMFCHKNRGWYE